MEIFAPYSHALAALAIWAVMVSFLGGLSTRGRTPDRAPCGKPVRDYSDPVYRRERAFMNAVEGSGPFIAATLAAILTGGPVFWVNLLASLFIVARVFMAVAHIRTENQVARMAGFASGLLCIAALAVIAFVGAVTA